VGTNRRYAKQVDQRLAVRAQQVASAPRPVGLSPVEVDLASNPARSANAPVAVRAWVHFSPSPARLEGVAIEWTDTAVHVEVADEAGRRHRLWVWASAVERVDPSATRTDRLDI